MFPQPTGCGLIEASMADIDIGDKARFRSPRAAALLKRCRWEWRDSTDTRFPQPTGCGLIEATSWTR